MSSAVAARDTRAPALERLLARLARDPRFPAFGASIARVNGLSRAEHARLSTIADGVLEDGGLTQELLRVVNTSAYRRFADTGAISTISRAVALLGMDALRSLAMSVTQLEHLHDGRPSPAVLLRAVESCVAGDLAREVAHGWPVSAEEAAVCAILQDLGWGVVCRHLPDEAAAVEHVRRSEAVGRARAFYQVLQVAPHELGGRVAAGWGVDRRIIDCMAPPDPRRPVPAPARPLDWLKLCTHGARDATRLLLARPSLPPEQTLPPIIDRYGATLAVTLPVLSAAARRSLERVRALCASMGVPLEALEEALAGQSLPDDAAPTAAIDGEEIWLELPEDVADASLSLRASAAPAPDDGVAATRRSAAGVDDSVKGTTRRGSGGDDDGATRRTSGDGAAPSPAAWVIAPSRRRQARIGDGIDALASGRAAKEAAVAVDMALEVLREALGCRRAVLCVRDPLAPRLIGRRGAGDAAAVATARMSIAIERPTDLLGIACVKNTDVMIADATTPAIVPRLPPWLADPGFDARCFLLLPMAGAQGPAGLLYADHPSAAGFAVGEDTLASLRTLRDRLLERLRIETTDPRYAAFAAALTPR